MALPYNEYILRCYNYKRFWRSNDNKIGTVLTTENSIESGNTNVLSIRTDISKDIIEIPCYCMDEYFPYLIQKLKYPDLYADILYYPVYSNISITSYRRRGAPKEEYKSANPAIKAFMIETTTKEGLRKIKVGDQFYYGGKGLILYEDMTPICMLYLELEKVQYQKDNGQYVPKYSLKQPIIKVNPRIYRQEDLMSKHIRTKFIQEAMCLDIANLYYDKYLNEINNLLSNFTIPAKFKIIIDTFDEDFSRPSIPNVNSTSENINNFLKEYSDNIVTSIS